MEFDELATNHLKTQSYLVDRSKIQVLSEYLSSYSDTDEAINAELGRSTLRGKLIDRIDNTRFIDSHIWDKLVGLMKVEVSISKKYVLAADNYRGALGELLYKNLFRVNAKQTYWLEIHLVKIDEATDPFAPSLTLRYEDLHKYELLIKMKMIEDQVTHNDKMNLKKVFEIYLVYQKDEANIENIESYLLTQSKLYNVAYFVSRRIFKSVGSEGVKPNTDNMRQENTLSRKYYFKDEFESKMKLNSRIVGMHDTRTWQCESSQNIGHRTPYCYSAKSSHSSRCRSCASSIRKTSRYDLADLALQNGYPQQRVVRNASTQL